MLRGYLLAVGCVLAACSPQPEKYIAPDDRVSPSWFGTTRAPLASAEADAEVVSIRGVGLGLLTSVTRFDGRFPGIARASANGTKLTYERVESQRLQGFMTEHGLLLLPRDLITSAQQNGLAITLCGVGTCYHISLAATEFLGL